jgi:hypothetical protein
MVLVDQGTYRLSIHHCNQRIVSGKTYRSQGGLTLTSPQLFRMVSHFH